MRFYDIKRGKPTIVPNSEVKYRRLRNGAMLARARGPRGNMLYKLVAKMER